MKLKYIFLLFSLIFLSHAYSQLSKKHYIPPLTSSDGFTDQYIYISTPKNNNVSYKITPVGNPDLPVYSGIVSNGNPVEQGVLLADGSDNDFSDSDSQLHIPSVAINGKITDKGFIIEANDVIYVSIRVRSAFANGGNRFHAGALVSKGSSALGTEFRIGGFFREVTQNFDLTFASIMATEDNTNVVIDDLPNGINILGHTGVFPINITLNEGESYIVAANGEDAKEILGSRITSDKAITVNSGTATGSFGNNQNNADYGFDQIVGSDKIGNEYILVRGDGDEFVENILVIANEDNTDINVNGIKVNNTALNAGEILVLEGNNYNISGNMYLNTTKPVFVYQGIGGTNNGGFSSQANQGMFFVPPLSCENKGDVDNIASIDQVGIANFAGGVTIVTNKGANVTINDQPITDFVGIGNPPEITTVSSGTYVTYRVTGLTGNIKVNSSEELYCAYFNSNGAASTGAFYSGFPSAPEINFDTTVASLGSCIPNVTLQAANTSLFDSFEWQYLNENTNTWEQRSTVDSYKPLESEPGRYRLIGKVDCTGTEFISVEIPVSLCPDDFDGDLSIDNLDIDLDNDGILNCDESLGNGVINFTNLSDPVINVNGSNINNFFTPSFVRDGNIEISGSTNGNFETKIIDSNVVPDIRYILDSNEAFNFEFVYNQSSTHNPQNSEVFEVAIGPSDKNVTLIDPDNILLVDTNFDGVFESGVTNYSSSVIRFTFNASPNGNTPFKFLANNVDKFIFLHTATSNVNNSIFQANLMLTCIDRDSDGDGIPDSFDLDSDNDGIPDLAESTAAIVSLSNVDDDENGLDNVFNGLATGVDTDGDSIPNYLDLDSDNDGIFDIVEAGNAALDADNDGIIDAANNTTVGINGLFDNLETNADDGILNYVIPNTDADTIFNFLELDADNDDCFDVIEAGFTGNGSGILFANPFAVDANGKVINNTDGYTSPNANYITSAPIVINNFPTPIFCQNITETMSIDANADTYQWQLSTDNGTNWSNLSNDAVYSGVTTKDLQITTTPISFNNYQFRVVLGRTGNSCPKESNAVTLTVNPEPNITAVVQLKQCDTNADLQTTFNLTEAEISITSDANTTFEYFATQANAIAGNPQVNDKTAYFVDTTGEAWVRTYSDKGCYIVSKIELSVAFTPNNPYQDTFVVCDDYLDADGNNTVNNSDTDGISSFDLSGVPALISTDPDIEIEFYETEDDRTRSINQIQNSQALANYRNKNIPNTTGNPFKIFYKLTSKRNNDCQGLGEFFLQIDPVPTANTVSDIEECDDALSGSTTDGKNSNLNLRNKVNEILGTGQTEADYQVTFHTTLIGASTSSTADVISNDTNYTNEAPIGFVAGTTSEQTIYVRVEERNGSQCFNANTSFKIIIQPIPSVPVNVSDLTVCDIATAADSDTRNRITENINLSSRENEILSGRTGYEVEFYLTQNDAQNRTSRINNPSNFQNTTAETNFPTDFSTDDPATQTIFFIVVDENGLECPSIFSTFQVLIYPEPNTEPVGTLSDCDNADDGDDTNGIIQDIDLNSKIPEILGTRNPNDYNVSFYRSQALADAGNTADMLQSPYTNSNSTETIFVKVEHKISSCFNTTTSFEIVINPLPDFSVTSPQILCLNNLPLNIAVENPSDVYSYVWTDENGNSLNVTSVDNIDVSAPGNYRVTATATDGTMCSREEIIEVRASNVATLNSSFVTIVDESNIINSENNLSISIDTINNDLGPGDYQFAILNTDNNNRTPFIGFQDEPLFENLEGGIYQIIVNDKNGCSPDTTLLVSVIQFPKFFTPNGDTDNDTWVIKGANKTFYPDSSINIFNRFGKLVGQVPIDSQGWNGTFQGKILPSDDYWYNITLVPADNTKPTINKRGHFSLIRK